MDPETVNPQIVDVINRLQLALLSPQVVLTSGAGKAYGSVAVASATAVQDAAAALRNATMVGTSAAGAALAKFIATGDPVYLQALSAIQQMMRDATSDFAAVGVAAANILKGFPTG